jgi:hypothetical protein
VGEFGFVRRTKISYIIILSVSQFFVWMRSTADCSCRHPRLTLAYCLLIECLWSDPDQNWTTTLFTWGFDLRVAWSAWVFISTSTGILYAHLTQYQASSSWTRTTEGKGDRRQVLP